MMHRNLNQNLIPWLLCGFIIVSAYSNAPGYLHSAITVPVFISFAIIFFVFIDIIKSRRVSLGLFELILLLCFMSIVVSPFVSGGIGAKTLNYSVAHLWWISFIYSIKYIVDFYKIPINVRVFFVAVFPTILYIPFEAFLPFFGIDLGEFITRVERVSYVIYSGFGFYRVRAFNYESAYLAMFFNVMFPFILYYMPKYRPEIYLLWIFSLFLTASLAQIGLFVSLHFCLIVYIFFNAFRRFKGNFSFIGLIGFKFGLRYILWFYFFSLLSLFVVINSIFLIGYFDAFIEWFMANLVGITPSALSRLDNLNKAINFIQNGGFFGIGMGGIQNLGYNGLASFYLALVVQLGILSLPFFLLFFYFFVKVITSGNPWAFMCFTSAFAHLLIIDVFYLPQVFTAILFVFLAIKNKAEYNN